MRRTSTPSRRLKNFPGLVEDIAHGKAAGAPIEIGFQDEARVGQKNKITRRWARRGTRPRAPHDQRTRSATIFGAICPKEGKGAGLVLPFCNSAAMTLHLEEISAAVAPGAHAVLVMDQAGWHTSDKLDLPASPFCHARPSSIRSGTSGSSCATTGCQTVCSHPTMTSSTTVVTPGTSSSLGRRKSCPSDTETGHIGHDQWDLVQHRLYSMNVESAGHPLNAAEDKRNVPQN